MTTTLSSFVDPNDREELDWNRIGKEGLYRGFQFVTAVFLGLICRKVLIPGLRIGFPFLAGAGEGFDTAVLIALGLMCFVPFFWTRILQLWLGYEGVFDSLGRYEENHKILVTVLGSILLLIDGYSFYSAIAEFTWSDSIVVWSAALLTVGYMAMVVSMSYVGLLLKARLDGTRNSEN